MIYEIFLYLLFTYWVVSVILLIFPLLIHKKKKYDNVHLHQVIDYGKCLHISHRGGSREGLENTIPTFRNAVNIGTNMLELDVQMTKDGKIVVCHDKNLKRLCGIDVDVRNLNYNELPRHASSVPLHFTIGIDYYTENLDPYFPLLEEVFEAFPNVLINIEVKSATAESLIKTGSLIQKYNREHLTIWGSKKLKHTKLLFEHFPHCLTFFSVERVLLTYFYFLTGMLPFISIKEHSLQVPIFTQDYFSWMISTKGTFKQKILFKIVKFMNFIDPLLFTHLKKRGIICIYWVANTDEDFKKCLMKNAHGIITDKPSALKELLLKHEKFVKIHSS